MSPFGSSTSVGDTGEQRLLDQADGEARLARARHPDDDAVGRQVAGADDDAVGSRLAGLRVEREAEVEGAAVGHSRVSLWWADARPSRRRAGLTGRDRDPRHGRSAGAREGGRGASAARAQRADRRAPVQALRRGPTNGAPDPPGSRCLGEGRRRASGLPRGQPGGCDGDVVPRAGRDRGGARLPVADPPGAARARARRRLQPLALRGRRRPCGCSSSRPRTSGVAGTSTSAPSSDCSSTRARPSLKVFLNVSREEQRKRLQERIDDPTKRWKFRRDDIDVHARYDDWVAAWDEAVTETSTEWAPWHVVPADRNWLKALAVAELLVAALERLDPQLPAPSSGSTGCASRRSRTTGVPKSDT